MPKNKKLHPYRSCNPIHSNRRFDYNGLEIYIPLVVNPWVHINGRSVMTVTYKESYDICTKEG